MVPGAAKDTAAAAKGRRGGGDMAPTYEILALSPGARTVDWSTRLYMGPAGETTTSAYFLWLLRGPGDPILVDTGATPRLGRIKGLPVEQLRTRASRLATAAAD